MDQDRNYVVLEYFRNSDIIAVTGSYIFIDGTGKWKTLLVQSVNMLLIIQMMPFLTLISVKVKNNNWYCLDFVLKVYFAN